MSESRRGLHEIFGINVVGNFSIAMMALEFQCHCCSRISPLETGTAEERGMEKERGNSAVLFPLVCLGLVCFGPPAFRINGQ